MKSLCADDILDFYMGFWEWNKYDDRNRWINWNCLFLLEFLLKRSFYYPGIVSKPDSSPIQKEFTPHTCNYSLKQQIKSEFIMTMEQMIRAEMCISNLLWFNDDLLIFSRSQYSFEFPRRSGRQNNKGLPAFDAI